jgi:flagellar basal-body rod protein FlgC
MATLPIFDVAASAMNAQSVRLNTVASNLANADNVSGDPAAVFKPLHPTFEAVAAGGDGLTGVRVTSVKPSEAPAIKRYEPGHPQADKDGYVYAPDIDPIAQMVDMISASRSYQNGVEVMTTARDLALATLNMNR